MLAPMSCPVSSVAVYWSCLSRIRPGSDCCRTRVGLGGFSDRVFLGHEVSDTANCLIDSHPVFNQGEPYVLIPKRPKPDPRTHSNLGLFRDKLGKLK